MAALDIVAGGYNDGDPGQFWSFVNYEVNITGKSATVRLLDYGFEAAGGDGDKADVNVTHKFTVNNTSMWTRTETYSKNTGYRNDLGNEKTIARKDKAQTVAVAYSVKVGSSTQTRSAKITVPAIEKKSYVPTKKVSGLKLERSGSVFKASWKTPEAALNKSKTNRFDGFDIEFVPDFAGVAYGSEPHHMKTETNEKATSYSRTLEQILPTYVPSNSTGRKSVYPCTPMKLNNMRVRVRGYRRHKGTKYTGPWCSFYHYKYEKPRNPTVSWSYDPSTRKAKVEVKSDEGEDAHERYDTVVSVVLSNVASAKQGFWAKKLLNAAPAKGILYSKSFDLSSYVSGLAPGNAIRVKCEATARGARGDSGAGARELTVARPAPATIKSVTCDRKAAGGTVKVVVAPGAYTGAMQLQRRHGTSGSWEDVRGATDNGNSTALFDSYGDAAPAKGEYVYYRVKTTRDGFTTYSAAKRADCIYTAKPKIVCTASVGIVRVAPRADGTSALVTMGFTDSTKNSGCELSWSDRGNAWGSTDGPSTHQVAGGGDPVTASWYVGSARYKATRGFTISGLTPGTTYYVRFRRYRTVGGKTYYSKYTAVSSFVTESAMDDKCFILSIAPSKSGESANVVVAFREDNANTGTELSWSTSSGAWSSTTGPSSATRAGKDSTPAAGGYTGTHTIALDGLTPGSTYYVRARRYLTRGSSTTYSPYSSRHSFTTESAEDDACGIIAISPHASGDGATLQVGYTEDNANTGTQVQWSAYKNAWRSNETPSSLDAAWAGSAYSGGGYAKRQYVYLKGLDAGVTYYVKARRYLTRGSSTTYSKWSALRSFTTAKQTAANDSCGIVSLGVEADGTGAVLVVGYTEDNANTGTEVTWSDDRDAWTSSDEPSKLLATWRDSTCKDPRNWKRTATIHLRGLSLGTTYYVRARRYLEDGPTTTYSSYSKKASVTTPSHAEDPDVRCGMVSLEPGDDGKSAVAVVGWAGDRTGCEVSWSADPDAWESSDRPQADTFDWEDAENKSGFYAPTEDAAVAASKTYYERTGGGTQADPYAYEPVASPVASGLPGYYELEYGWPHTSTFRISGLDEGVTCYVRARSYFEGKDGTAWSDYTGDESVTPCSAPSGVSLFAPLSVARGEPVELYWSVESEIDQAEWHVHESGAPNVALAEGEGSLCHGTVTADRYGGATSLSLYVSVGCGGGLTDSNEVTVGIADAPSCEVTCAGTCDAQPFSFEVCSDQAAAVRATCRSLGVTRESPAGDSDQLAGRVVWTAEVEPQWREATWGETALRASLESAASSALAALEAAREAAGYVPTADAAVDTSKTYYSHDGGSYEAVELPEYTYSATADAQVAEGKDYYVPDGEGYALAEPSGGEDPSAEGWLERAATDPSGYYEAAQDAATALADARAALDAARDALAAHPADGACFVAELQVPGGTDLVDNGAYEIAACAVEHVAGLAGAESTAGFSVAWAHQAPVPPDSVVVLSDVAARSADIVLAAPEDALATDVYDVYRRSQHGWELAACGMALGAVVRDPYAPFGRDDLAYRVCCRTADGDEAWADYPYVLPVAAMRFDFGGESVELPWNVELSDSFKKDFEARAHADGSVGGYFDRAVEVTGSYRTDVVKIGEQATVDAVRRLGMHAGPCFCRTSQGMAFECNADVDELGASYSSTAVPVRLSVTAVGLTEEYMARPVEEDGEEAEGDD